MATAKRLPSGRWRCLIYVGKDENGNRKYKSCTADSKKEAIALAADMQLHYERLGNPLKLTLGQAIDRYIDNRSNVLSPSTILGYRRMRRCNFQELMPLQVNTITSEILQASVNSAVQALSRKTVANAYGLISAALREALPEKAFTVRLPAKTKNEIKIPDEMEIAKLEQFIRGNDIELPILLALHCGMRLSEVMGVKGIDIANGMIHICRARVIGPDGLTEKPPKSLKGNRWVPMSNRIEELTKDKIGKDEFIIDFTEPQILQRFYHILKRAGLPHMRFHDLRHYFASVCLKLNIPERYAMDLMGHSTPGMLKRYQHILENERKATQNAVTNYWNNNRVSSDH